MKKSELQTAFSVIWQHYYQMLQPTYDPIESRLDSLSYPNDTL
jgi:hypothetical protein